MNVYEERAKIAEDIRARGSSGPGHAGGGQAAGGGGESAEKVSELATPLSDDDLRMIDQAWEHHKAALPVATVINDNQPGRTAIIEITIDPPTLPVGTKLYAEPKAVVGDVKETSHEATAFDSRRAISDPVDTGVFGRTDIGAGDACTSNAASSNVAGVRDDGSPARPAGADGLISLEPTAASAQEAVFLGSPDPKAVAARLRGYANDPMWADHGEVPKSILFEAAQLLTRPAAMPDVEAILSAKIDDEGNSDGNLQYVLIRGFSAMGWAQPTLASIAMAIAISRLMGGGNV